MSLSRRIALLMFLTTTSLLFAQPYYNLTILHHNDANSKLVQPGNPAQADFGGAARFKTLMDSLRTRALSEDRSVLVLSSGNNLLAGPEFNNSLQLSGGESFYDSRALDLMGYDAIGLGNHEFDFGPEVTARFIEGFKNSRGIFVASNLDFSGEPALAALANSGVISTHRIVSKGGEKIGILSVVSPELATLSSPRNVRVKKDVAGIVNSLVDTLESQGVNKIILLSNFQGIREDSLLISQIRGVDVVVAAFDNEILSTPGDVLVPGDESLRYGFYPKFFGNVNNRLTWFIKTGSEYKYIGRFMVRFDSTGWAGAVNVNSGLVRVAGGANADAVTPNEVVETQIVQPLRASLEAMGSRSVGTSEVELDGTMTAVRTRETNLGDLTADALLWRARQLAEGYDAPVPDVALMNGGGIRNNTILPAGMISELTTFNIAPFANFITVAGKLTSEHLKEIMENAVSRVETIDGRFMQVAGMTIRFNPLAKAQVMDDQGQVLVPGKRIEEIRLTDGSFLVKEGEAVTSARRINVATTDFIARGGDQYAFRGAEIVSLGVTYQQALAGFIPEVLGGKVTAALYPAGGEGRIVATGGSGVSHDQALPAGFKLHDSYPNPFNSGTTITYELAAAAAIRLSIYNLAGQEVASLFDGEEVVGVHTRHWDGRGMASGVYLVRLTTGAGAAAVQRIVLMK